MSGIGRQSYYQHKSGIEMILLCEVFPFNLGTAVKYLGRVGVKPGVDPVSDLVKCADYLFRSISIGERHDEVWANGYRQRLNMEALHRYMSWYQDHPEDGPARAIWLVTQGHVGEALTLVRELIDAYAKDEGVTG